MAEHKPKNSKLFYRVAVGVVAFLVLTFGIYYFVNKNKPSADIAATSTKTLQVDDVGISNYTTNCKSEFLKLSTGYRCNKIKVTIENAPANLTATSFFSDLALKKKVGDAIIQNGLGGFTNFSSADFCTIVRKNISPNVPDATQIGSLIEKAIIYDSGIKKGCDTVDNAGTNNVSSPYQVSIPDVTIKLAAPAVAPSTTATAQPTSSASTTQTSETKCLNSNGKYLTFTKKSTATDVYWESSAQALLDKAVQKLIKDGNEDITKQKCLTADATTKVTFKVITNTIKDAKNVPVNTARISVQNTEKGYSICTTDKDGACSLTKADLKKIVEQFKGSTDTNDNYQKQIKVLAYKSFKEQTIKSPTVPISLDTPDYEFKLALDEAQAGESINYASQGMPGIDSGLPTLGNNAITFSAKRESNKELVRVGGVSFELTGKVDKTAKAAGSNALPAGVANTASEVAKTAAKAYDPKQARTTNGGPSAASRIVNSLGGGSLPTTKGVIPDDGRESRVTIPNLPDGTYQLVLRKSLYGSITVSNIILNNGVIADYDSLESGGTSQKTMLKPSTNAEPPTLPLGYTANKIPLSKNYLVASKGKYVANATDNLYYSFIEPRPGWTNNIFTEKQLDLADARDQQKLEKMVNDCISQQSGMNTSINANVSSNTLKNLGYFNAAYQLFLNPDKGSNQDALMQAISGIGLTQILAKSGSGSYNVNIDLFNKCGINPSIIRNPAYNYNYGQQTSTSGGSILGPILGFLLGGQNSTSNGAYYGDSLTLGYCQTIQNVNTFVEDPQLTQDKLICQQRYGSQLILSSLGNIFGVNANNPYSAGYNTTNTALNKFVATEFQKLRSCAGSKIFVSDPPIIYDQNTAQQLVQMIESEYQQCSLNRAAYTPNLQWRDFNFLTQYGFIDSGTARTNKILANVFQAFKSCAGNKVSPALKAPTPANAQIALNAFSIMADEYDNCTANKTSYTPRAEWIDFNFLRQMGFLTN